MVLVRRHRNNGLIPGRWRKQKVLLTVPLPRLIFFKTRSIMQRSNGESLTTSKQEADTMPKRFTETAKWDDPWFLDLSSGAKLLWLYLVDKCDNSGVIELHQRKTVFETGLDLNSIDDLLIELKTRINEFTPGKIHIRGFVDFQYGELKESSNLHKSVLKLIEKHN